MILDSSSTSAMLKALTFFFTTLSCTNEKFVCAFTSPQSFSPSKPNKTVLGASSFIDFFKNSPLSATPKSKKIHILLCPAQFCVPDDYKIFFESLQSKNSNIASCRVAPLPRTEWIKVAQQLPTLDFWRGDLNVLKTLYWYFDAIDAALTEISNEEEDGTVCLIGHSIGGWVARAYLGGLSQSYNDEIKFSSFVTLGTPHINSDKALVDQTRGLLTKVCDAPTCSSTSLLQNGIRVACIGSSFVKGNFLTTNVDEIIAASSYFPLTGDLNEKEGDGIVPTSLVFMEEPANKILLDKEVRHSHVLPTPWNLWNGYEKSIELPEEYAKWYGSEDVIDDWIEYIV